MCVCVVVVCVLLCVVCGVLTMSFVDCSTMCGDVDEEWVGNCCVVVC